MNSVTLTTQINNDSSAVTLASTWPIWYVFQFVVRGARRQSESVNRSAEDNESDDASISRDLHDAVVLTHVSNSTSINYINTSPVFICGRTSNGNIVHAGRLSKEPRTYASRSRQQRNATSSTAHRASSHYAFPAGFVLSRRHLNWTSLKDASWTVCCTATFAGLQALDRFVIL